MSRGPAHGDAKQGCADKRQNCKIAYADKDPEHPSYDFVLVEQEAVVQSGALALAETGATFFVGYYVEPYIVCQTTAGAITHHLVDRDRTRLLGRVIFRTSFL